MIKLKQDLHKIGCPIRWHNWVISALFQFIIDPGFRSVVLYRLGYWCRRNHLWLVAVLCEKIMHHLCFCAISTNAVIGGGFVVRHVGCLVIGGLTRIGENCDIRHEVTLGGNMGRVVEGRTQPVLGDNIIIGVGAKILGPVVIGNNSIIGANAVVISSFPENSIIGGVPAVLLKSRSSEL